MACSILLSIATALVPDALKTWKKEDLKSIIIFRFWASFSDDAES